MRGTDALDESLYDTGRPSRRIPSQRALIMVVHRQALYKRDSEDDDNVDVDIGIDDEESKLDLEWAQATKFRPKTFFLPVQRYNTWSQQEWKIQHS